MVAARSPSTRGVVATHLVVVLAATAVTAGGTAAPDSDTAISEETDEWVGGEVAATDSASNGTNATVMVGPRGTVDRLTSVEAIERARENGRVTPSAGVAKGDTVVFRLRLPGITEAVANASGDNDDSRFRSFLGREDVSLRIDEKHVGPHRQRQHFHLDGSSGQSVAADAGNDTYYVAADLGAVPLSRGDGERGESDPYLVDGDEFAPRFIVDGDHRLNPGDIGEPNRTGEFTIADRDAALFGADHDNAVNLGFAAAPNQTVRGHTSLAPGSTVTVTVTDATGTETPLNATARVTQETVETDGYNPAQFAFETALDLSAVKPGSEIEINVTANGTVISGGYHREPFRVPVDSTDAEVRVPSTSGLENGTLRVDRAALPHGGFVVVASAADGSIVAATDQLEPGTHENLRFDVGDRNRERSERSGFYVFLAHDSNGDGLYYGEGDRPYADGMEPVGEVVQVADGGRETTINSPATASSTANRTATDAPTTTEPTPTDAATTPRTITATATVSPSPRETQTRGPPASGSPAPGTTSSDGPGFGAAIAVACLFLTGLYAVGVRRRDG